MQTLIFGTGYVGHRVAKLWQSAGYEVHVATRSEERAEQFRAEGLHPIVADVTQTDSIPALPACDVLLYAVGFDRSAAPSIQQVYADGLANVLKKLPVATGRVIYVSSTGVYGRGDGEWVDESTPPDPQRAGGVASLAAEEILRSSPFAERGIALRLAGIYGPGRVPYFDRLRAGEPLEAAPEGWLNLTHVDDAVAVINAAARNSITGVVNVCDGNPVVRGDYYAEVARLIDAPPPKFVAPAAGSPKAARSAGSRRIGNDRMRAELLGELQYPSYREGLADIVARQA